MNYGLWTMNYCLNPRFVLEVPHEGNRDAYRKEECEGEAPSGAFHTVHEVHTKETGDERGEHEDNADAGEHLHHLTHVVVDEVGIGVHRGVEDVGVDVCCLARLAHLDTHVLYHICVQFVNGQLEL